MQTDLKHWMTLVESESVTSSLAFRAWFAGSKVVDDRGDPLAVYHGTRGTFTEFFTGSHFGSTEAANARLQNTSGDPEHRRYTGHHGMIMPVYLSIKHPLRIIDDYGLSDGYNLAEAVLKTGVISRVEYEKIMDTGYSISAKRRLFVLLNEKGYDGLVYKNAVEGSEDSWIPFWPNQIKSVFNNGSFSASDNIMEALGKNSDMQTDLRRWMTLCEANLGIQNGSIVQIQGDPVRVSWDEAKDAENRKKHDGLSLVDGLPVIVEPTSHMDLDYDNQNRDERERYIGRSGDRVLVVVCEWFDTGEEVINLRLISVRHAMAPEIRQIMNEDIGPTKPPETPIDPDNPPLTGREKLVPAAPHIKAKLAAFRAKVAERKARSAKQTAPSNK